MIVMACTVEITKYYSIGDQHCWTIIIILAGHDTFTTVVVASQA